MSYLTPVAPFGCSGFRPWPGLGTQAGGQQTVAIGATATGSAAAVAAAAGLIPTAAIPFIGPAIAGIALAVSLLVKNSGCGQTCIETSQWANQAATQLDQNIAAYFATPIPRPQSVQTLALQNFDSIWARLYQMCSDPSTGNAGKRCISDRQAGSCAYTQTADKVPPWGTPAAGQCWNWFAGYRDPISNDLNVVPDSALQAASSVIDVAASPIASALQSAGVSTSYAVPILIAGVALLILGVVK